MQQMKKFIPLSIAVLFSALCMGQEKIPLYPDGAIPNAKKNTIAEEVSIRNLETGEAFRFVTKISQPELSVYLPDPAKNTGIGVIICPGGGYMGAAIDHEGYWMAEKLKEAGIAAFVLKYRMPMEATSTRKEYAPLQDAQRALQLVRGNARKWRLDPDRIGIAGSSAGGHLASTAGTHYAEAQIPNPGETNLRPDFMILNYPVISFADSLTHGGSRRNLIGRQDAAGNWTIPEAGIKTFSNELWVTPETPPSFVTHAVDDPLVDVRNSVLFIAALQQNRVPVESFFYATGGHGYGMDNPRAEVDWIDPCIQWILGNFSGRD